jgi:CheY-like chemotaxis protein
MLDGRTVLVVETQFIVALSIQTMLETFGATVVLAGSARDPRAQAALSSDVALAIMELEVEESDLVDLARTLAGRGIPVIGMSADSRLEHGMPGLPGTPILMKPIPDEDLEAAIVAAVAQNE